MWVDIALGIIATGAILYVGAVCAAAVTGFIAWCLNTDGR